MSPPDEPEVAIRSTSRISGRGMSDKRITCLMRRTRPAHPPTRPVLDGMPPSWQFVYDRLREAHAAAVIGARDAPGSLEAAATLRVSTEAVRAFHRVYQEASAQAITGQIEGAPGGAVGSQ